MHLIQQQHIEVQCSDQPFAHLLKDELGGVFEHDLYPKLEQLLDRYDVADEVCRIDHLTVEIPPLSKQNWKRQLVNGILMQVEEFLKNYKMSQTTEEKVSQENIQSISKQESLQELLIQYLKKGSLPSNAFIQRLDVLFETVVMDQAFAKQLEATLKEDLSAILRWSLNIPDSLKEAFCEEVGILTQWKRVLHFLKQDFKVIKPKERKTGEWKDPGFGYFFFWLNVFRKGAPSTRESSTIEKILTYARDYFKIPPSSVYSILKHWESFEKEPGLENFSKVVLTIIQYLEENDWESIIQQKEAKKEQEKGDDIQAILEALQGKPNEGTSKPMAHADYIANAGLVILHPFLVPLFQKLGYLEDVNWKNVALQHRAVLLLQYCMDFNTEIFESDLLLNKILCGVGPTETVAVEWEITKEEKEQCEKLLQSVIEHWAILKNTSVETFQETFLQRNGKLVEYKENTYELTVEQKGLDVLLDHLPWGIGTIKTPWMEHYLSCYWM